MALERFIPKSPDINIRNSQDFEVAKFGHLNTIVEYINNNTVQPAGLNGYVQFNDNAALGGDAGLFWDNTNKYLGIGTTTPIGILHLYKSAATTRMVMDGDAGQSKIITYRTGGLQRFGLYVNNTAESGSNAGSNFAIRAYSDAGTLLNTPVFIKRSTGNVGVNTLTGTAKLQVVGSGSTSATTSLLVQNSAGTAALTVRDDSSVVFNVSPYILLNQHSIVSSLSRLEISPVDNSTYGVILNSRTSNNGSTLPLSLWGSRVQMECDSAHISTNSTGANASAMLDVTSTTKGFLPPRMTTTQINAIVSPAEGLVAFNTTISHLCCYQAGAWVKFNHSPM
jgi:hypothetical protein